MLQDIQNTMSLKRANNETSDQGVLMNAMSGERHIISKHEDFIIGRALSSSIVLDGVYVSRHHCIIRYKNNQFIIYDNNANSGTFINCEPMNKGEDNFVILKHGDLISFGYISKNVEFIYKFILSSDTEKRFKLDNVYEKENSKPFNKTNIVCKKENSKPSSQPNAVYNIGSSMSSDQLNVSYELEDSKSPGQLDDKYKMSLTDLHTSVMNIKIEEIVLKNSIKVQMSQFQKMFVDTLEYINKLKKEQNNRIQEMTKQNSKLQEKLNNIKLQELSIESFKDQIFNLIENDFQCSICNEIMLKANTANCNHTFCHSCITMWLKRSKICPVCRTNIHTINNCLVLDNFITNICNQIGGTMKEQRDNLINERAPPPLPLPTAPPPQIARRGAPPPLPLPTAPPPQIARRGAPPPLPLPTAPPPQIARRGRRRNVGGRRPPSFTIDLSSAIQPEFIIDHPHIHSVERNINVEVVDLTNSLTR